MAARAARVDGVLQDLEGRLKAVEDELNDEDPAEGADQVDDSPEKPGGPADNVGEAAGADDGFVNIGDPKTVVVAVASEVQLPKDSEPVVGAGLANTAAQSVHGQAPAQGSPTVSSLNMVSKGTLKGQVLRKSGGRKKPNEPSASQAQSGVASSSKSPGGKAKRRG